MLGGCEHINILQLYNSIRESVDGEFEDALDSILSVLPKHTEAYRADTPSLQKA